MPRRGGTLRRRRVSNLESGHTTSGGTAAESSTAIERNARAWRSATFTVFLCESVSQTSVSSQQNGVYVNGSFSHNVRTVTFLLLRPVSTKKRQILAKLLFIQLIGARPAGGTHILWTRRSMAE